MLWDSVVDLFVLFDSLRPGRAVNTFQLCWHGSTWAETVLSND